MKGISNLRNSRNKVKTGGLGTIQNSYQKYRNQPINEQKLGLSCAYHSGQKITNFCKNSICLLPLCPKCVKIHTEQHEKMGWFGNFEFIDTCLQECIQTQKINVQRIEQIVKISQKMAQFHQQQFKQSKKQLQKAKFQMLTYIQEVFQFYDKELQRKLIQLNRSYESQLVAFHKEVCELMESEKVLLKKYYNKNLQLEFLIDFYSKQNVSTLINNYSSKIQDIKPEFINLAINTYQLERLKVLIKKYLDFGKFNEQIIFLIQSNPKYQTLTLFPSKFQQQNSQKSFNRTQYRSPIKKLYNQQNNRYGFGQKGQISKIIMQKLQRQSKLDNFQSPLENYTLEKNRRSGF